MMAWLHGAVARLHEGMVTCWPPLEMRRSKKAKMKTLNKIHTRFYGIKMTLDAVIRRLKLTGFIFSIQFFFSIAGVDRQRFFFMLCGPRFMTAKEHERPQTTVYNLGPPTTIDLANYLVANTCHYWLLYFPVRLSV